ncbi:hypothetical protein OIU78_028039 [Salix suchowensis]|nr:hypothetical protein OIU78_028039 [Salix suchowensis]
MSLDTSFIDGFKSKLPVLPVNNNVGGFKSKLPVLPVNKSARFKVAGQKRCGRKEESNFSYQHSRITFFLAIATPCPLGIKCAIWALYRIATCNFLLYSGGALTHAPQVPVVEGAAVEAVKEKGASAAGRAGGGNVEVQPKDVFENSKNCSDD